LDYFPWNYPSSDTRDLWCWFGNGNVESSAGAGRLCQYLIRNKASRVEWDRDARTQAPTFTTVGNNARAGENWGNPFFPTATQYRPSSPTRDYVYPWTNVWFETLCAQSNFVPGVGNDISAAVVNLFAMHNRMHDWSYRLGFTETAWNMQADNGARGGLGGDPEQGNAQAGARVLSVRDNANQITGPDGVAPITNMYLWQPIAGAFYAPCVDGDFDMAVIGHEYGHLIENRMIGKGGTRSGHHAGAMGESSGDLMAAEYLNEYGFAPVSGENPFGVGAYATANHDRAIRNYGMNFPRTGAFPEPGVNPRVNPLNFSDMGYDIVGQQVHANGEIWSATNYDIRQALVAKYGAGTQQQQQDCADGKLPTDQCPGNRRWIQIMFDAYLLMPTDPSMLEARDAYLAADVMRFGGANQAELWNAFARRGFGQLASSTNASAEGTAASDTDPAPNFESPHSGEAVVKFAARAVDEGNAAVPARVFVGHYEARVSPIADTNPATGPADGGAPGASNLDDTAAFVPGTYEFVVQADGYGAKRFRLDLAAGETKTVTLDLQTNWASRHKGATASGDGAEHNALIDDTEATNWDVTGATPDVTGKQVTVDLAGSAPRDIASVNVSAMLFNQNRFTALRQFELQACTASATNAGCTAPGSFASVYTSPEDAFPGFNPRPVAPEMILRTFTLPTTVQATHLRLVVLDNQCTGDADFHGEQDLDPVNPTDCRNGAGVVADRDNEVHVAELQAFGPVAPPTPQADLSVVKTDAQDPVRRGQLFDYVITVSNAGPNTAQSVTLTDTLPKNAGFSKATTTQGTCASKPSKGAVTCALGNVAAGGTVTVRITMKATDHGTVTNSVSVGAQSPADPNAANNSDTEQTTVR
ncbi:MAG TPA: M36 family metallopeptidase, partial [Actinomycetota bacterium]|nr:M36 family metallopeptidase [Actinomycetota bacterium]